MACVSAGQHGLLEQVADQACDIVVGERREGDRERVSLAAAPSARGDRAAPAGWCRRPASARRPPVDEVVDEVEQGVVGPVKVLEHQHQRVAVGQRLEKPPPGRLPPRSPGRRSTAPRPRARPAPARAPRPSRPPPDRRSGRRPSLCSLSCASSRGVGVEDARLGVDHLPQRPVGDAVAVWQRPSLAPGDEVGVALDRLEELPDEPALADAGNAHQRDQLDGAARPGSGAARRAADPAPRRGRPAASSAAARRRRRSRARASTASHAGTGCGLALGHDRLDLPVGDRAIGGVVGRLADQDAVDGAADWSRAAVLTTSPDATPSPRAASAPEHDQRLAGVRRRRARAGRGPAPRSFSRSIAARIESAARTARSGSSSWATGAPKSAITASPMNFSTVPP